MPRHLRRLAAVAALACAIAIGACADDDTTPDPVDEADDGAATRATDVTTATGETGTLAPSTTSPATGEDATLAPYALGPLALGQSTDDATATGLIGDWQAGCELSGETDRVAPLRAPLVGEVHAFDDAVYAIVVTGGPTTTAEGVGVGTTVAAAEAAFTDAGSTMTVDSGTGSGTDARERAWTVTGGDGASVYGGSADPSTGEITTLATPFVPACG